MNCKINSAPYPVLVVEDDPNDILLIKRAFQKSNVAASLQVVQDGELATNYLLGIGEFADRMKYPIPGLMLLDLKLPRRNGLEVLMWLRQQETSIKRLPVVVFTSSQQLVDVNRAYDLGANSYMVKPGGFDELIDMVKSLSLYWFTHTEKPQIRTTRE